MPARPRRLIAALAGGAALLTLSGCGAKPTPIVTLYSGDTAIHSNAAVYCFDGQDPSKQEGTAGACRYDVARTPELISVQPGAQVLVDVDKDLADAAWFVTLRPAENAEASSEIPVSTIESDSHTVRVQPDFSQSPRQVLTVRKLASDNKDATVLGLWTFLVVPKV